MGISKKDSHITNDKLMDSNKNHANTSKNWKKKDLTVDGSSRALLAHEVQDIFREPFITSGYRDTENITVSKCLATMFSMHNETVNIWSHVLAAIGFMVYFNMIFAAQDIIGNPSIYPLVCFAFGICLVFSASAFAHLFSCMSWRARHTCFYIDYATISIFSFTAGQAIFFYCRPIGKDTSDFHKFPFLFLGISFSFSCLNMFLSCLSRHRLRKYRFLIRTGLYLFKFLFDISPFLARCEFKTSSCCPNAIYLFNRHVFCYAISGITNACRVPERWFPGLFDYIGHSHHFLHILTILANFDAFTVVKIDMIERSDVLASSPYQPTFFSTFGSLILLICANTYIGVWFVSNWLKTEEEDLLEGSKYLVIYRKENNFKKSGLENENTLTKKCN